MLPREEFSADETTADEPSGVVQGLGTLAVILGSLGCASVLVGLMTSEDLFLGGGVMSVLALVVGLFTYIRSRTARLMLLLGLFGLILGGMTDTEIPGYAGFALSMVALVVGLLGDRNGGQATVGALLGLCGTLACLGVLLYYLTRPQEYPRPGRIEVEETGEKKGAAD